MGAGGFGRVELGKPLEAALEVGKGGGGFEGGVAAEVMDLGLETVIGGAIEVQVSGMAGLGEAQAGPCAGAPHCWQRAGEALARGVSQWVAPALGPRPWRYAT